MAKKDAAISNVRIIGIFAHVDAGKTTTSEAILYHTGRIHRAGKIDDGNTQLDWMDQERERGITIMSAATACHWKERRINLIDTPGHIDFSAEVVRSIRVIDGAVMVLCAVGGVEPQTEAVWGHANGEKLARLIYINKLDRLGGDFERTIADVKQRLTPNALPLQLPIGTEDTFRGVVDILTQQALVWEKDEEIHTEIEIPADMVDQVQEAREKLIDTISERDDEMLMLRLEGKEPSLEALKAALRKATIAGDIVPILCGASREHIGVEPLLDAIVDYLPAPVDMPPTVGHRPGAEDEIVERHDGAEESFCATAFKIMVDPYVGHLTWMRVFSGTVNASDTILNARAGEMERIGRIYRMHANRREQADYMSAGDVVAVVGMKSAMTGDTLCDPNDPIILEAFEFPEPVISVALAPKKNDDRDKLHSAVRRLCDEDPTLIRKVIGETGELTLSGMGELHLEVAVERLRREFGVEPNVSLPQVSYRETVQQTADVTTTYRKQSGGHGHYARVELRVEPLHQGEESIVFENITTGASLPREYIRPVEMGVRRTLEDGVIAGYPITNMKITLLDGDYHEVDSATIDFEIVGSMAVKEAMRKASPSLLEPIMSLDVNVPEEYLGPVVADLGRRRGLMNEMRVRGHYRNVEGDVPLAEVRGYATDLRSLTQGRGTFSLKFKRYEILPAHLAEPVIEAYKESQRAEAR